MRAMRWKKNCFVYFLLPKYIPVSWKYGGQKQEWRYPSVCVGSYFIADENIQTYLICLQSCNMQKHQKANFWTAEYVCVQQRWLKRSITHVSWRVTSWNVRLLSTFASSNNANWGKHCCYLIAKHCQCQDLNTKATMLFHKMHLNRNDNFASHYGNNKNLWNKSKLWFSKVLWVFTHPLMMLYHVINKNFWFGRFYHGVSHADEVKRALTGCHLRLVKHSFMQFGGHLWHR